MEAEREELTKKLREKIRHEEWMKGKWEQQGRKIAALEAEKEGYIEEIRKFKEPSKNGRNSSRGRGKGGAERGGERNAGMPIDHNSSHAREPTVGRSILCSKSGAAKERDQHHNARRVSFQSQPPTNLKRERADDDDCDDDHRDFASSKSRVSYREVIDVDAETEHSCEMEPNAAISGAKRSREKARKEAEAGRGAEWGHSGSIARIDAGSKRPSAARTPLTFA